MSKPLWTDERMIAETEALGAYFDSREVGGEALILLRQMRDEYEAELARVQAAAYEQVLDEHEATLARARVRRGSAPGLLVGGEGAL